MKRDIRELQTQLLGQSVIKVLLDPKAEQDGKVTPGTSVRLVFGNGMSFSLRNSGLEFWQNGGW